jgi:hypothetical protein
VNQIARKCNSLILKGLMGMLGVIAVGRLFVFGICLTGSEHFSFQLSPISFQLSALCADCPPHTDRRPTAVSKHSPLAVLLIPHPPAGRSGPPALGVHDPSPCGPKSPSGDGSAGEGRASSADGLMKTPDAVDPLRGERARPVLVRRAAPCAFLLNGGKCKKADSSWLRTVKPGTWNLSPHVR